MKVLGFSLAISLLLTVMSPASALTFTGSATGLQSYGLHTGSYQNGDFYVRACCGEPMVGDAQEEWTSWAYDFTADDGFSALQNATSLAAARLTLQFRTGGDTPNDDVIYGAIPLIAPFGFTKPHSSYSVTLDLLALGGEQPLLAALRTGKVMFSMGNDSSPYFAVLQVDAVPEPDTLTLAMVGIGLVAAAGRFRQRKNCQNNILF